MIRMNSIAPDKKKHLIAGFVISAIFTLILVPGWGFLIGGPIAGGLKEIYDVNVKKTEFDIQDVLYTMYGAFAGSVVTGILIKVIQKIFF